MAPVAGNAEIGPLARILPQRLPLVKCLRPPFAGPANRRGENCGYPYILIYLRSDCSVPFVLFCGQLVAGPLASWFAATAVRGCAKPLRCLTKLQDRAHRDAKA
ncbi:hypothetical protein MAFF301560_33410 [Ralstonia solanacearum]|nr:hypothetical protein MAFF301560_33410 [Ralstonia solanacearum]BEU45294.1 hypothetical protein MAFF211519_06190 [Ralstonia pseudosolanacearum]